MNKVVRHIALLGLASTFAGLSMAAEVDGVLVDRMCSMKAIKDGQQAATMHTRDCALMPDCQKSGYGVFTTDGKYLAFDQAGNEKALKALQNTKRKDNLRVKISGDIEGQTIKVDNLKLL